MKGGIVTMLLTLRYCLQQLEKEREGLPPKLVNLAGDLLAEVEEALPPGVLKEDPIVLKLPHGEAE
jgi:hypothetical protein